MTEKTRTLSRRTAGRDLTKDEIASIVGGGPFTFEASADTMTYIRTEGQFRIHETDDCGTDG